MTFGSDDQLDPAGAPDLQAGDASVIPGAGGMPPAEELAVMTISRLAAEGYASMLMKLPRPILNETARRLVTPGVGRADVFRWLAEEKGESFDQNTFYRFAQRFAECYRTVWGELASKLLLSQLAAQPGFDGAALQEFSRNRLQHLIAQELVTAQTPSELETKRIYAIVDSMRLIDQQQNATQKLAIARDLAQHRIAKLEADVEKLQRQQREAQAKFEAETKARQEQRSDKKLTPEDIAAIRTIVFGGAA